MYPFRYESSVDIPAPVVDDWNLNEMHITEINFWNKWTKNMLSKICSIESCMK